jgi:hypothetical protein
MTRITALPLGAKSRSARTQREPALSARGGGILGAVMSQNNVEIVRANFERGTRDRS